MYDWTLMKRLIWVKAAILSAAGSLYNTVTGAIASFTALHAKVLKKLVVDVNPVQDLHGYANPWPGGAGVNILPAEYTETITLNKVFTFAAPLPAGQYTFSFVSADTSASVASYQIGRYKDESEAWTYVSVNPTTKYATFTNTEPSSKFVVFSNKAYSESTGFTTVFTGLMFNSGGLTTYAPYANECPISGWTGAEAYATGENMWDEEWEIGSYDITTGEKTPAASSICSANYIPVKPGTNYLFYLGFDVYVTVVYYDKDKNFVSGVSGAGGGIHTGSVITTPSNAYYMNFGLPSYGTTYRDDISINYPATTTGYHAYVGDSRQISWQDEAGTVYAATVTVKQDGSVDLVSTHRMIDMGQITWQYRSDYQFFYPSSDQYSIPNSNMLSSIYKILATTKTSAEMAAVENYSIAKQTGYNTLLVKCTDYTDRDSFKAAMAGVQLLIPLMQPVTYHLDSITQLSTIVGTNNIWANTGDVTVTYYAA